VPLGALAHLIPAVDGASDPLALLQRAASAIVGGDSRRPPVLAVDDVHLLDKLSMTLLYQLAAGGAVSLVLTVRSDCPEPDPVAPLWKDGLAVRIDVSPLERTDMELLVTQALGGEVQTRTEERLWQLTRGNPLFLREVLEDGHASGRLQRVHGFWQWEGPMRPSQRLSDIVLSHIGDLDATEWRALEVLATSEPLSVHQLAELSSPQAIISLERRGVITDYATGGPDELHAAHPMYTAVVRARASEATLRMVRRQLFHEDDDPGSRPEHLVKRCVALLDSGQPVRKPGLLIGAARRAMADLDVAAAERLARAALDAGDGIEAHLLLVEVARWLGEPERSFALAVDGAGLAATEIDRARLTSARVLTLFCALGRGDDAAAALRGAVETVRGDGARGILAATESMLSVLSGDPRAVDRTTETLSAIPAASPARSLAAAAASLSLAHAGRTRQALSVAQEGWRALESGPDVSESLLARFVLAHAEVGALQMAAQMQEMNRRTEELLRRTLAVPEWAGDAVATLHCGLAALASGQWRQAVRRLEEAHSGLQRQDPMGMRGLCCSVLAMARALVGDLGRARELITERESSTRGLLPAFEPFSGLAKACLAGVEGRTADAGELFLDTAAHAAALGLPMVQALVSHRAVQFGRAAEVAELLRDLAVRLDSPLVEDLAAHAQAMAGGDGDGLEKASWRLQDAGALMYAADSAAAAAAVHERRGDRGAAVEWATRAAALARECGMTQPPTLGAPSLPTLTSREEEVAGLASRGLSNQEIADMLVLSVRTVETHLSHVYAKLGITSRAELAALLLGPEPDPPRPRRAGTGRTWPLPVPSRRPAR